MNGLFGGCGHNHDHGCGGGFGGFHNLFGKGKDGCGLDCCTIILIIILLTCCCGCDIDWCTIIVIYLLFSCCGMFCCGEKERMC